MMKRLLLILIFSAIFDHSFSQSISTIFHDENNGINANQGTTVISDAKANGGTCMFRPATAAASAIWFGPYVSVMAGDYLVQARIKVSSNISTSGLFAIDVVSQAGTVTHGALVITPAMFKTGDGWQLITFPVAIPHGITNLEIRGMAFQPSITDVYFDYVQLIPSSLPGLFSEELTISGKGDIGIGTTTPREKLSVNGKIRTHEIKVETSNWPDYVFEEGYQVVKLNELESYIKTHRHLPDMPSAKEVETNGIALGEMVKLQQQKIEELTLHLIEKDKQLIKLKQADETKALVLSQILERLKKLEKN
jgi:hypothetical protein